MTDDFFPAKAATKAGRPVAITRLLTALRKHRIVGSLAPPNMPPRRGLSLLCFWFLQIGRAYGAVDGGAMSRRWKARTLERFKKFCSPVARTGVLPHPGPLLLGEGETRATFRHGNGWIQHDDWRILRGPLISAFSARRGRIVRRVFGNTSGGIGGVAGRTTESMAGKILSP
jgi:hypothetical protein